MQENIGVYRKKIGVCDVDSGQLMILDPCYLVGRADMTTPEYYKDIFCCDDPPVQLKHPAGHDGMGVRFDTEIGDGTYPVYAHYKKYADGTQKLLRIEVEILPLELT